MEPSNLSPLQEEGSEGQSPSVFAPDSIPPRPASHFKNHLLLCLLLLLGLTGFESNKFQMMPENIWIDSLLTVLELAWVIDKKSGRSSLEKYAPLEWSGYFDKEEDVTIPGTNNVFHVYMAGSEGPVVFCLHGGGYSGLSFALSASIVKEKARVVAMDLRGHGKSSTDNDLDLSIETLRNDVLAVLKTVYGNSPPAIILVGHSMGGSVAVHVAAMKAMPNVHGLVVVDVVEGTAIASLIHMQKILSNRMQYFPTIEKAVQKFLNIKLAGLNYHNKKVKDNTSL
ncbi:putative protein phosphatase methylesterase 1 [Cocos nucifera]|nr:putative protein phosphatase methylesterase 1 [Cocos nucifera]